MGKLGWMALIAVLLIVVFFAFFGGIQRPSVAVTDMSFRGFSGGAADLVLAIEVDNPNIFGGTLTGLDAVVYIDGRDVGPANTEQDYPIGAQTTSPVEVIVHMQHVPVGGLTGKLRVAGTAHLKIGLGLVPFNIPFDQSQ